MAEISELPSPRSIDDLVHQNKLTVETLDFLFGTLDRLRRTLEIVYNDYLIMKKGVKIYYALDFFELYNYLWPYRSNTHLSQISKALLHSKNIDFTLPPGALFEFIKHLKKISFSNRVVEQKYNMFIEKPIVKGLLRKFENEDNKQAIITILNGFDQIEHGVFNIAETEFFIDRLEQFNLIKNLVPFDDIVDINSSFNPYSEVLHQCLISLDFKRPVSKTLNNIIDAQNFALISGIAESQSARTSKLMFYVTSSPIPYSIFNKIKHDFSAELSNFKGQLSSSLVRHPLHVIYLSKTLESENIGGGKLLKSILQQLTFVLRSWSAISKYSNYIKSSRQIAPYDFISLPRNQKYLLSYNEFINNYKNLFSPVFEAIRSDMIAEENISMVYNVDTYPATSRMRLPVFGHQQVFTPKTIFDLLSKVNVITFNTMKQLSDKIGSFSKDSLRFLDSNDIFMNTEKLYSISKWNENFQSTEVIVANKKKETIIAADFYSNYFAIWWNTGNTFIEFMGVVRHYISSTHLKLNFSPQNEAELKKYMGIYIFHSNVSNPLIFSFNDFPDLDPFDILEKVNIQTNGLIQMIKIATDVGDLFYDFGAYKGMPQRAGLVSHIYKIFPLALFISETNRRKIAISEIERILKEISPQKSSKIYV